MLRRIVVGLVVLMMALLFNSSCTKRSTMADQHDDIIKGFAPNPMPPDSLELDSLKKTGFK